MSSLRLSTWLIALILTAVLPSFVILLVNHKKNQTTTLERAITKMEAVATLAAATHEQSIEGVRQILGTIASGPSVRRHDLETLCAEFIGNVASASPSYSSIGVLTLEGRARCLPEGAELAVDFSDRQYFKDALSTEQFTVGEYLFGRVSEKKALTYSVPIYDYLNRLKGVAYVGLDLEQVDMRFKEQNRDPATQILLVNSSGLVLASTHKSAEAIGDGVSDENLLRLLVEKHPKGTYLRSSQTDSAMYALAPVEHVDSPKTFVVARAYEDEILGPELVQLRSQLVVLVSSTLLGIFAAWAVARRKIALPIAELVKRMNAAGSGRDGLSGQEDAVQPSSHEFNILNQNLSDMLEQLQLHQAAIDSSSDGIVICDATKSDLPMVYVNPAIERITGYPASELLGKNCRFLQGDERDQPSIALVRQSLKDQNEVSAVIKNFRRNGSVFWNSLRISPVRNSKGTVTHFVGIQTDVTDRVQNEEELARRANHDWLTGLPNRSLLEQKISLAIERSKREQSEFVLAFIDLDNFKVFNDSIGHAAGDAVLVTAAKRLSGAVRSQDLVCRLGGDEFVVVYEDIGDVPELREALSRLQRALEEPVVLQGKDYFVAASIGIAVYPRDGENAQSLIQHADIAMYKAKADGRGVVRVYAPSMSNGSNEKLELANDMRRGLSNREFELHYQPKIDAITGRLCGFEALLRWRHPTHGLVSPMQFIALAEQSGFIVALGRWVLQEVCLQMQQWREKGTVDVPVAVNVSGIQFRQDDLCATISDVLSRTGLLADRLHVEITESVMIDAQEDLSSTFSQIRAMGVKIALDDFGTGYSSLSYLKRFPVDYIKIDKSFVRDITSDPADAAICGAIIAMAHNMGMEVIAEGVETTEQAEFLRTRGCDQLQGYLIGVPKRADELTM